MGTAAGILVLSGIITLILPKSVKGETEPEAPAVTGTTQLVAPLPYAGAGDSGGQNTQTLNWGTVGPQRQTADTGYTYTALPAKPPKIAWASKAWLTIMARMPGIWGRCIRIVTAPSSR